MIDTLRRTFRCSFAVLVILLCFAAVLSAKAPEAAKNPAPEWKSYSYPADGFKASFPSIPEFQKSDVPTEAGSFELRAYRANIDQTTLYIGVSDFGTSAAGIDPDTLLQGSRDGALSNTKAHLISEKKITLGIYHGIAMEAQNDAIHFSARIYLVGTTQYQTLVVSPLGKPYADTTLFLDSFQLIARTVK
jgi:hypothetical protein